MRRTGILIVLALFLGGFIFSVARMERLLANGTDALLRLAPVDPRALLTGDYMALEYEVNPTIFAALRTRYGSPSWRWESFAPTSGDGWPSSGQAVMRLASGKGMGGRSPDGVPEAVFVRLDDGTPLAKDEVLLSFRVRGRRIVTAAPAFYFQEGDAGVYEKARYGRVRLDGSGKSLLVALCDVEGRNIRPEATGR